MASRLGKSKEESEKEEESEEEVIKAPRRSTRFRKPTNYRDPTTFREWLHMYEEKKEEESEEEVVKAPPRRSTRGSNSRPILLDDTDEEECFDKYEGSEEEAESEEEVIKAPSQRSKRDLQQCYVDDTDDEFSLPPPAKKRRERCSTASVKSTSSPTYSQSSASTQITTPATSTSSSLQHLKLNESFTDKKFHDVILTSSDATEITTHRCVLAKYSNHFANLFEQSKELPIKISIKDFNAETIQAAVDFMFGKPGAISGNRISLFKFAAAYNIPDLLKECCAFVVQRMDVLLSSSICEYIKIAYEYNLEELKEKCLKILVEKRKEIDAFEFADLPKNILSDFFVAV
uniref:BTB domain-containing protein n=1 Tax=Panagrolaimus sp. ES5 TaxID=591445 RepID=A0AC34G0Z3_9BILA